MIPDVNETAGQQLVHMRNKEFIKWKHKLERLKR